jgi:ubiquinone/menaquinone biosynthesis C-methylase UbiE
MAEVPYSRWINFISAFAKPGDKIIDVGCGTGTVTCALALKGYQVVGLDPSPEMLSAARFKADQLGLSVNWLQQRFVQLNLRADMIISTCDGINHILNLRELVHFFRRAFRCLNPGGCLIFDFNTEFKYRRLLASGTFAWEIPGLNVVWQNNYSTPYNRAVIMLYKRQAPDIYAKSTLEIVQRCYPLSSLVYYLRQSGFSKISVWNNYKGKLKSTRVPRITVVAHKIKES